MLPHSEQTKLESFDQKASSLAVKNTSVVLVSFLHMEMCRYSYFYYTQMIQLILAISNCTVRGYFSLTWKDSVTHMHGLLVYLKDVLSSHGPICRELSELLFIFSTDFTSLSVLFLFPLSITFCMHSFWCYFI